MVARMPEPASPSMLHSLDHVILAVRDLAAAREAYRLLLGREPSWNC
jgi:hypothetical protein